MNQLNPKADYDFYTRMLKVVNPTQQETDEIFRLYKKYIQNIYSYTTGCNCSSNIANIWDELKQYMVKNRERFE